MTLTGAHAWTVGLCNSCIVVMAGRWIMFDNGAWDFKIDNDKMGRAVDSSRIRGDEELKTCIVAAYGLLGREVLAEMSYWLNDGESEMVGLVASPVEIATDKDFRIFKALHRADKSVNLFVTLRESVGGKMIFLRSERVIWVQMNAPVRPPDEDVAFLMEVQQIEERYKRNSLSGGMVATSKDQDKSGETLADGSGANSENCEQEKGNVCLSGEWK
ncbi:BnaCnng22080D [Brassica napus]|uniref:BnaCnng22080D protein n=1 Tax=Brassica napus TaxID=3708 RepID=A0A078IM84_BRANA|nr:BnaCnng22080D [Brassica napus]